MTELFVGKQFSSYTELTCVINQYEKENLVCFSKRDSRKLESVRHKVKYQLNPDLVYYEIKFTCIKGGPLYSKGSGIRKSSTLKIDCPAFISLRTTPDGQFLEIKHLNLMHNHEAEEVKLFTCSVCSASFRFPKNLYQHMRKKHNIEPSNLGKISCPLLCAERFRTHQCLRDHLESFHGQVFEKEELNFPDIEDFNSWKKRLEMTTGYAYSRRISEKTLKTGEAKTHYICHRSGNFKSESAGLRKLKKTGSNKIGSVCPSVMEVTRDLIEGKVHVEFWKTHIGHEADILRIVSPRVARRKFFGNIAYDVCAVLPAAGIGERMGLDVPKQYISIHEKPVICHTVEAFLRIPFIKKVVVVASSEKLDYMLQILTGMCTLCDEKLLVTEGCGSRHQSIDAGLKALQTCCVTQPEVVVIHDGVRPIISEEIVGNVVMAAKEHGAAGVVCPLVSTVISIDDNGFLEASLDRNKYKASEMPQAFQFDIICQAYKNCSPEDLEHGTECLLLVQKYCSVNAKILPGSSNLWKITHRKDIYTAAACIKENQSVGIINSQSVPNVLSHLQTSLGKKFSSVHVVGKLSESSFSKYSNLVYLWTGSSIYDIIQRQPVLFNDHKTTNVLTVVHIIFDSFDESLNFYEVQREAKNSASESKASNIFFYMILVQKHDSIETIQEISELSTSLLFDSNPYLSGNVFFIGS